ncbi:hypothetical protein CTI12_AA535960 [Artemisia annua]|uniref:Uncharacterized protein n=1 Tax=Artemisia annua TaxID=35608 RepID=A0A2U1L328_ARTAN|nr:hypothetical protein CTI12_AA535960 [Artemisia annua]
MWQVLLAAALAGSGYVAKNILYKNENKPTSDSPKKVDLANKDSFLDQETSSVFRFSSTCDESKNNRKKLGRGGVKGNGARKNGSEKKIGGELVGNQGKNGKKFVVSLKKRRTGKNAFAKCDSFDVKDKSSFGYGVGVGIMYMMSTGKAEINRLNAAVDETAKVVQELKAEISKRKSSGDCMVEATVYQKGVDIKPDQSFLKKSSMENDDIDVGYASSILTEEPQQNLLEMDQLEAELECELLKLHVSTADTSSSFQVLLSYLKTNFTTEHRSQPQDLDLEFNHSNGVMPFELDQKLCHLLIEQQESQIVDLESELQHTNSKLMEKEYELQALKDCVKRLTEFSLTCPSDDEKEGEVDEAHKKMINGHGRSIVGIKRAIDFD